MSSINFKELLSTPVADIKRPLPQPAGTWYGTITGYKPVESRFKNDDGSKDPQVQFIIKTSESGPGIDPEEASRFIGRSVTREFSIVPDQQWGLKQFLESLGCEGSTLDEQLPQSVNVAVQYIIEHTQSKKDPEIVYANTTRVSKRQ